MYFGFCLRVLVLSLLTLGQDANALGERRGGSSGIEPLFEYTSNHKLVLPSDIESSAQAGRFIGSSGSSHSAGGQVERYSPEGSVSSYGSNPNAKGVIQTKAGVWDYVSPENGKRFVSGIASSGRIVMKPGPRPPSEPKPSVYQLSVYQPKPLQPRYLSKPQQPRYPYSSKPQQAVYQPKPQQVGIQIQPGMSELFSPTGGVSGHNMPPINLNVQMTVPPRTRHIPMSSQQRPRWQHSMVPV
ncbi:uncharacterized protein LOC117738798 [Cyclopterus lumpus]|uniref:uncharacterized protein LOC117738797 n=1 Tax=Cyclopterus lumpus TaxID=8103 RepID=UPI0014861B9D|nr:uncharacterized protein LOC117738797 [Cyclopterus lumpus]XP_034400812.1 uncharacterized protein LOC117738798 [Cyclopterus lumpus]